MLRGFESARKVRRHLTPSAQTKYAQAKACAILFLCRGADSNRRHLVLQTSALTN